jgi:hypothetical protein
MINLEFSAFHRLAYWQRLTAFLFILRSWSPTHSNVFFVLDFYDKQQFVCQPNISKNLFVNIQQKNHKKKQLTKKVAYIPPTKDRWVLRSFL